jgi:hypothetical protein
VKKIPVFIALFLMVAPCAQAFNLWYDIEQNTQWTLGENAAAGTAYDIKDDQFVASELAGIASYRFLSGWYGGTQVPQNDNTVKWTDTFKIGFNLNYFLTGFANRPPEFLQRIVIGPSFAMPVFVKPHRGVLFIDVNYVFGSLKSVPTMPPVPTTPQPTAASRLNLYIRHG